MSADPSPVAQENNTCSSVAVNSPTGGIHETIDTYIHTYVCVLIHTQRVTSCMYVCKA